MIQKTKSSEIDRCFYCYRRLTVYKKLFYGIYCKECAQNFKWEGRRKKDIHES